MPTLYRGVTEPLLPEGTTFQIREDRRPRDTGSKVIFNACFNLMIERHFGFPLIRRRSLFVSGDILQALKYAAQPDSRFVGEVVPNAPFSFIYATNVKDSAALAADLTDRYLNCFYKWQLPRCELLLQNPGMTLSQMDAFFIDNPDIDLGGFSWSRVGLRQRILQMLDDLLYSRIQRTYRYTNTNLLEAVKAGVEILIFDAPNGYFIKPIENEQVKLCAVLQKEKNLFKFWS